MLNHLQQRPSSPTEPMQLVFGLIFVVFEHKRTLLNGRNAWLWSEDRRWRNDKHRKLGTVLRILLQERQKAPLHASLSQRGGRQCASAWHRLQDPRPRAARGLRRVHRMALIGRLRARSTFICTKLWRLNWGSTGAIRAASNTST